MSLFTTLQAHYKIPKDRILRVHTLSAKSQKSSRKQQQDTRQSCKSQTKNHQSDKNKNTFDFQLHDPENCVCNRCDCGQHKCQIQCIKPDINKKTTYQNSYKSKINHLRKEEIFLFTPSKLKQKVIDLKTIYQEKYNPKPIKVQKSLKTEDHQKFEGPSLQVTTYQQKFPGYNGKNPYFKTKPDNFRGGLRFRGNSMYNSTFTIFNVQKTKTLKQSATLKTQGNWFGRSSYRDSFWSKNDKSLQLINYKPKVVYNKRPSSAYQFQSSYQTMYENPSRNNQIDTSCPAKKVLLELKQKSDEKDLWAQKSERKKN